MCDNNCDGRFCPNNVINRPVGLTTEVALVHRLEEKLDKTLRTLKRMEIALKEIREATVAQNEQVEK